MALDILMVLDVIVSILMIGSILLQSGKSAGFSGMGGGESLFGGKPTWRLPACSKQLKNVHRFHSGIAWVG
ncbi:preprotein translocase subunit SecG [Acidaminococcus fermentans]|uniref:preprotein translocase subunit SecG n=1 Tax=Acidaminococcus fermentans TaxID=905 RepID=UPI00242ED930|nr:preprotein translocase subunit SecG [Acidaminococcus fermentans]